MIRYSEEKGALVCSFAGKLDTEACQRLSDELYGRVREAGAPVIFDLGEVDYISSAFLRICLTVFKGQGAAGFSIVNAQPSVKKVFMIAGFDKGLSVS